MKKETQENPEIISEQTETDLQEHNSMQAKKKFKVDKKHIQGFVAGILVVVILYTGVEAAFNPDFLTGTFTNQVGEIALQDEIDIHNVAASPASIKAGTDIDTSFVLDIPTDKLNRVKAEDLYLWGFFNGMKVTEVTEENGKLKVNVNGTPLDTNAYDSDEGDNGYISLFGEAVKDKETGYTVTVSVIFPRFTSVPERLEANTEYDTDILLTLSGDTFIKAPAPEDITLNGTFKDMKLSNISQNGNTLSFHIKGSSSDSGYNGHIGISKNVLESGFTAEKVIPVEGAPALYSITPITVEAPFEDTLVLRISNDFFTETITSDMFTLGGKLLNATIGKVEYIDNTSIYITLCGNEIRKTGIGTITLSSGGLQSGRTVTAEILIKNPSISMKCGNEEILASASGKEYKLTVFSEGNDFMAYLSASDFMLKDALSGMEVKKVKWINGYKTELTLKGTPAAGSGIISVRSAALGGVTGAECSVNVTEAADFYGQVNLSSGLPEMAVSFYDKDGNALNIPTATTEQDGSFIVTVTPDMPVDPIAFLKAKNDKMELRAHFCWDEREDININAFTTLMQDSIAKSATREAGIEEVYRYLELADSGLTSANYKLHGKNSIFSHQLFESQANGDVNGYIRQLEDEMQIGKTRSFVQTSELTGETGGLFGELVDWTIGKIKDAAVSGIKSAITEGAKTGLMYLLREIGILGPSTEEMLEELQASVDALSDQVRNMQEQLSQEIKEAELQGMLNNLGAQLNTISSLNRLYRNYKADIVKEVDAYKVKHQDSNGVMIVSELPYSEAFFGQDGEVANADLYSCITNIINILNAPHVGKPLISVYYDVLKGSLPFEHNAGEELYYFANYVTSIEAIGIELYSGYCLFNDTPILKTKLNTLMEIFDESIVQEEQGLDGKPALLPSSKIFGIKYEHGQDTVTVRCNYNGKYYTIPNGNLQIKDDLVTSLPQYQGYHSDIYKYHINSQDFKDLFHYRELYYPGMKPKQYLEEFGEFRNLPDWLIYDHGTYFMWIFANMTDQETIFYDTADNVYLSYYASDLYERYSTWCAKAIYVYDW